MLNAIFCWIALFLSTSCPDFGTQSRPAAPADLCGEVLTRLITSSFTHLKDEHPDAR